MPGTSVLRFWWSDYRCLDSLVRQPLTLFGRNAGYCASPMHEAFSALEQTLIATGYTNVRSVWVPRSCPTGIGGATCSPSGSGCSLHNYGIAIDIDPYGYGNDHFRAPFGRGWDFGNCKLTRVQVEAVEAIKNTNGERMFRWLGWPIGDTMHFEAQVPPSRTTVNWNTVPVNREETMLPLTPNSNREDIRRLQDLLNETYELSLDRDGKWGALTAAAVKARLHRFTGQDEDPETPQSFRDGYEVNANMWNGLMKDWVKSIAKTIVVTVDKTARLEAARAHQRLDGVQVQVTVPS